MPKPVMNLYPFEECVQTALLLIEKGKGSVEVYQQFNCAHCGTKQTMDQPNTFYGSGTCEECGATTDIRANGMNYMVLTGF